MLVFDPMPGDLVFGVASPQLSSSWLDDLCQAYFGRRCARSSHVLLRVPGRQLRQSHMATVFVALQVQAVMTMSCAIALLSASAQTHPEISLYGDSWGGIVVIGLGFCC